MFASTVILLIGFSVIAGLLLLLAYFFVYPFQDHSWLAKVACAVLLLSLCAMQLMHLDFLLHSGNLFESKLYSTFLFATPPSFYFLSREVLQFHPASRPLLALHLLPSLSNAFLSNDIVIPLAFSTGTAYALWLTLLVFKLRAQHKRGRLELIAYGAFFFLSLLMFGLGLATPFIQSHVFVMTYASLIGIAFTLIVFTLLKFPDLINNATEAARAAYAATTLKTVDCNQVEKKLKHMMEVDKVFTNENLNLNLVAKELELSGHQLSELINTRFGIGFSRYIREQRIAAAKRMLLEEPNASVLSIGLSVGFTSQSNFYAAFREITGDAPGQFRKQGGKD
ncbi:MAG: helix-turn-helix domain-containing protein [Pseudomonadota bacterium]